MYASQPHVEALTPYRPAYTATSTVTATDVAGYLEDTAVEIDAILRGKGYSIPIATSATSALRLLQNGNALGAAARVQAAAPNPHPDAQAARDLWMEFKKTLVSGELELDASTRDTGDSAPRYSVAPTAMIRTCMEF